MSSRFTRSGWWSFAVVALSLLAAPSSLRSQAAPRPAGQMATLERGPDGRPHNAGLPGWCETPVADRKADIGCYTTASSDVGALPRERLFWHLDRFDTRAAAEANRGRHGVVVESHHRQWLFTIAAERWRPTGGEHVASVGPLETRPDAAYTARFLETVIPEGAQKEGAGHRHPGPEAWYLLEGGQCLETPSGMLTARAGETMLAPEGEPMAIASYGAGTRRAIVLILHRTGEAFSMPVGAQTDAPHAHWRPTGRCPE
jgi:quercetin dioxygenase-like cupin family protein